MGSLALIMDFTYKTNDAQIFLLKSEHLFGGKNEKCRFLGLLRMGPRCGNLVCRYCRNGWLVSQHDEKAFARKLIFYL